MQFIRMNIKSRWAIGILASCLTFAAVSQAALSTIGAGEASFRAVGPGGLKIDGKTKDVSVSEAAGVLTVTVGLKNLKTGIDMRDDHMKKAIHADKHGSVTLKVKRSDLKFPEDQKQLDGGAVGQFTLNGVTKPVKFAYRVKRTGSDYHVQGRIGKEDDPKDKGLNFTKHNIEKPCYLGVCVDEHILLHANFKLREQ